MAASMGILPAGGYSAGARHFGDWRRSFGGTTKWNKVERKTVPDFLAAMGQERERFERELRCSRHCGAFGIIVEGDLRDVIV
ncbi:MAG: hypothetical protein INR62_06590 [Rhodospirillales bacterium]|nr:hypothetical protein [Acetobacter sp.]